MNRKIPTFSECFQRFLFPHWHALIPWLQLGSRKDIENEWEADRWPTPFLPHRGQRVISVEAGVLDRPLPKTKTRKNETGNFCRVFWHFLSWWHPEMSFKKKRWALKKKTKLAQILALKTIMEKWCEMASGNKNNMIRSCQICTRHRWIRCLASSTSAGVSGPTTTV